MDNIFLKRLRLPLSFLMLVFIMSVVYHVFYLGRADTIFSMDSPFTLSFLILALLFFLLRCLDVILWTPGRKTGFINIPRLFIELLNIFLLAIVLLLLVNNVFHKPITGILAASGVLGVIIALSIQRILSDVFIGISISMDKTINIYDWIEYRISGFETVIGQIKDINWRTIILETDGNNLIIIPNGLLTTTTIKNLSKPSCISMFEVNFPIDLDISSSKVLKLLEASALSVRVVLDHPKPQVLIADVTDNNINYVIRFWIDIEKTNVIKARHLVYYSGIKYIQRLR